MDVGTIAEGTTIPSIDADGVLRENGVKGNIRKGNVLIDVRTTNNIGDATYVVLFILKVGQVDENGVIPTQTIAKGVAHGV